MRLEKSSLLACLLVIPLTGPAAEMRIAAWNLEHLDDIDGAGCVGRTSADYAALARRIEELDADIVAVQEVENTTAGHRVFPASNWNVEMSRRPVTERSQACWDRPEAKLGHRATGFAIRRGIRYRRNADLETIGGKNAFQRWGTDITISVEGRELRLLSVHFRTGCWGARQDGNIRRRETCAILRNQFLRLKAWVDARHKDGTAFVILGDFNRRLALPGDWAWRLLSTSDAPLRLLTEGQEARCDPRFPAFIDHLLAGGGAETKMVAGSFREWPRAGRHPDHCAISAEFRTEP